MGTSQRRRELRAKRKTLKEARLKNPGKDSKYARKLRGIYPPRSPYLTGAWGAPMKALRGPVEVAPVPSRAIVPRREHPYGRAAAERAAVASRSASAEPLRARKPVNRLARLKAWGRP